MNFVLERNGRPPLAAEQVLFIHGTRLLSYGKVVCLVSRRDLIEACRFEAEFHSYFKLRPVCILACLIPMEHKRFLIELLFGPPSSNESPEIIGKPDFRKIVKIV